MSTNTLPYDVLQAAETEDRDRFYNPAAGHGPITGSGPGFEAAMQKFQKRQDRLRRAGKWRAVDAAWAHDDGDYIDVDYYIVDWTYLI